MEKRNVRERREGKRPPLASTTTSLVLSFYMKSFGITSSGSCGKTDFKDFKLGKVMAEGFP